MDTTDPNILFDEQGVCNHCRLRDKLVERFVPYGEEREERLEKIVSRIRDAGKDKEYNCIIGVSGGADSTYAAYKAKQMGLKPLAVHLDNGWNSELAVQNIEQVLKSLNIELYTHVIDWEEFKDLQLSFLKASTPDSEIPTDHAIVTLMRYMAKKVGVQYVLSGINLMTESHLPKAWSQGHVDWKYIKGVHKQFGSVKLKTFPHMNIWKYAWYTFTLKTVDILNYVDYVKADAVQILKHELNWKDYGSKHFESIYTRFYQGYILIKKFGFDKRKTHFSSLICSGQMSREEALNALKEEPYPIGMQQEDRAYLIKKFNLTDEIFEDLMNLPPKSYWDYPSYGRLLNGSIYKMARKIYHRFIRL
jgi:N-acetyl sugar amidotransferase